MTPERWRQVEEIYYAVLEKDADERGAFLVQVSSGDEELRREVESLLAQASSRDRFLSRPAWINNDRSKAVTAVTNRAYLPPGSALGPYTIESQLGAGGMGVVYRARDTRFNRTVAIKLVARDRADDAARHRFEREVQIVAALNHPNILTVHDAGEFQGRQYLVTEFVDGGTLQEWSRDKRTWQEILDRLIGVADGLAVAHAAGVIHRDIKPANILVASNGYAKLGDFGIAKLIEGTPHEAASLLNTGETRPGTLAGTLAYMSPEQASGGSLDTRSDVFSFGVVLYEMLAGHRPFAGATDREVLLNVLHNSPPPLPQNLSVILRTAVEKALEKDPADRYQSIREMVVDLKRVQRSRDGGSSYEVLARPLLLRRRTAVFLLFLLLLIGTGIYLKLREADYFWRNPLAGARAERLTDFEGDETDSAISPDGQSFVFLSSHHGQFDAWASRIGSGEFVNITNGRFHKISTGLIRRIGFSRDGAHICLLDGEGAGPYAIWRYSSWELRFSPPGWNLPGHPTETRSSITLRTQVIRSSSPIGPEAILAGSLPISQVAIAITSLGHPIVASFTSLGELPLQNSWTSGEFPFLDLGPRQCPKE
jgi:eukaryotic-like serine/threonine-protein kinase